MTVLLTRKELKQLNLEDRQQEMKERNFRVREKILADSNKIPAEQETPTKQERKFYVLKKYLARQKMLLG